MAYFTTLPDFPELEQAFKDSGLTITCDLSNEALIYMGEEETEENMVEWDKIPQHLQDMLTEFQERNELF